MAGRRPADRQDGAISVMAAVLTMAVVLATALVVDVGRVAYVSRDQQGVTDRAALDAVLVLSQAPAGTDQATLQGAVEDAVQASLGRNPGSTGTSEARQAVLVELGFRGAGGIFQLPPCSPSGTCTLEDYSAVRIQTTSQVPFVFGIGARDDEVVDLNARVVRKEAIAETLETAQIRVGSELAAVSTDRLTTALEWLLCPISLDPMSCTTTASTPDNVGGTGVSVLGYQGLAGATVELGELVDGLGLTAGSVDQVLETDVALVDVVTVTADALDAEGNGVDANALRLLAAAVDPVLTLQLGDLLDLGVGHVGQVVDAELDVLDLVHGSLQAVNGDNLVSLPDLGVSLPGTGSTSVRAAVVEAPRTAIGRAGETVASTAQVRLELLSELDLDVADSIVEAVDALPLVTAQPVGGDVAEVSLPIDVQVARATAGLMDIACSDHTAPDQAHTNATVDTVTSAIDVQVGDAEHGSPADLASFSLEIRGAGLHVATAHVDVDALIGPVSAGGGATGDWTAFGPFPRGPDTTTGTPLSVPAVETDIAVDVDIDVLSGLPLLPLVLDPILDVIFADLTPALVTGVQAALGGPIAAALNGVDDVVLEPVLSGLGVGVANADTWVDAVDCDARQLAPLTQP